MSDELPSAELYPGDRRIVALFGDVFGGHVGAITIEESGPARLEPSFAAGLPGIAARPNHVSVYGLRGEWPKPGAVVLTAPAGERAPRSHRTPS
jgi:hypothetical protein